MLQRLLLALGAFAAAAAYDPDMPRAVAPTAARPSP